jgi:hypothetical protein
MSAAHFCLAAQDGHLVPHTAPIPSGRAHHMESARRRWPPVVAALTTALDVTEGAVAHFALSPPSFGHAPRCSALCRPLLQRCFSPLPQGMPHHRAPPAPRACPQHRLAKPGHRTSPPSSSSVSTSPTIASSACSPTLSTPQRAPRRQRAPPRPPLRPPRPLPWTLTGVSSLLAHAPP